MVFLVLGAFFQAAAASWASATHGQLGLGYLLLLRGLVWFSVLTPWAVRHPGQAAGQQRRWLLLQALCGAMFLLLFTYAVTRIPLALTTTIMSGTSALWVILLVSMLSKVRPLWQEVVAMLVAALGITLIVHPEGEVGVQRLDMAGLAAAFAAAATYAVTFVVIGRVKKTDSANVLNLWCAAMVLLISLPLVVGQPLPGSAWLCICGLLYGLCGLLGQTFIVWGTMRTSPAAGSTAGVFIPVFAALIGTLWLAQSLSLLEVVGMLIVVVSAGAVSVVEKLAVPPESV
ncbi:DMT family transporter [bacterium]|nr:DMT family transporter [bacterium]